MRGWRRMSVIWFLGFGVFLLLQPPEHARMYANA
jgi:hypothetical protein